ncbi:unnamed protein product [Cuscuta campestris]|uniref:Integrase catalytic domain-containing protein n=1 Tax=Cuscuta campestris TaxID=132261 RepID=A0A484K9H6_9ASTE|nr:unnamed protein product [Cuscuta campestris]
MSMFQQPGGFSLFNPGLYPQSSPQTNVIRPIVPTNLIEEMDKAGLSRSRRSRSRRSQTKGKAVQPEGSRRSAFQRLGHDGRNQNRSAKERLGVETIPASAFNRAGRGAGRPGQTRRTEPSPRDEPQHSRAPREEEAESHPRHTTRSHVEQPRDRVGRVEARLEKLQCRVDREEKKKILLNESSFTDRVHETPFPKKAKLEVLKFTGKEDPEIHVKTLHQSGRMMGLSGDEKCLLFFQTLRGRAAEWFHNLPADEIDSFDELAEDEVDKVEEMDDKTAMSLLVSGLRSGELYKEFCRRPPQSYQEAYNTAWDYADAEAQVSSKREAEQGHSKGKVSLKKEITLPGKIKAEVMEVKPVKTEKKLTSEKQWTEKYCSFHKTDSHNTAECNSVKGVIKQMIEAGEIDPEYLAQAKQKKNQWVRPEGQPAEQNKKKKTAGKEHLQVIYGGPEGGDSASQRKKWGRELYVGTVALNPRSKQARREPSTFTDRDLPATGEDHNDPLVITMDMGGVDVSRVLVDTGSNVNVLYLDAFEKLKLCRTRLEPLKTPLSGFTGDSVEAEGSILLTCRPGINKVRGVISMAHLCMKFYTPGGIGQVRGDQKKARHCYLEAVKKMTKAFERVTLVSQEKERSKLEPGDETEQIVLREAFPERMVRIGRDLPGGLRGEIISILREYADIFAWSVADMPGIDRSVICHRLAVMEGSRPVKQKKRHLANVRRDFVKKEVKDLLAVGHIREFRNPRFTEYLASFGIKHSKASVAYPQGNGQVENANRTIVDGLKKRLGEEGHKWLEALPHTVWAHRVTSRRATGETPFVLTYGCEARLPVEAEIPTFRETVYQPGQNEVDHLAELNLVEERRTIAAVKMAGYQQSVKRYYDSRVGPRYFQVHDEVLRRRDASKPNERGKLARNLEGPYRVKTIVRPGTYQLETMEGSRVERHWNSHHLRKFYR